jgi:SNF2 family DNA or RNA helicase
MTGTPIDNRPSDYYNLLRIIKHDAAKDWKYFMERYCNGYIDIYGRWNTKGASNLEELYNKTKDIILRRTKEEVLVDFPNKFRHPVWLKLENRKKYETAIKDWQKIKKEELGFGENESLYTPEIAKIMIWRMFCAYEKIEDGTMIDLLQNEIEKGNKIFMLTNFTKVLDYAYEKLGNKISCFIDGRVKSEERLKIIEDFNDDPEKKVLISNMAVGTIGYNIQSANVVYINDLSLKPSDMIQGEDRAHRIGQTRDVDVLYPLYKDTVEEYLYDMLIEKNKIVSTVIDGKEKDFFKQEETITNISQKSILEEIFAKINSAKV